MQELVQNISNYARSFKKDFIIIPQNGVELAFKDADPFNGLNYDYLGAVDGFGVEELFYNGNYMPDFERIDMLQNLKGLKKILVSEYVSDSQFIADALVKNQEKGFVCFPREGNNYNYEYIPGFIPKENADDITQLAQVKNYLYLISSGQYSSKAEMIQDISSTNFDLILTDLYFNGEQLSKEEIEQLKTKANGAKRLVISYISIGSAESFRYYWKSNWSLHHPTWIKKAYSGYPDEYWVKFWKSEWQEILYGNDNSYLKKILDAGFDGAYLDNVEAYYFLYFNE